ncbi:MAG: glycosyltransferase [Planctomycetes bacterium]|nr:glycosyltransferase [Planctomycetota bacterium]
MSHKRKAVLWIGRMIFGENYRVREVELATRLSEQADIFALDHTAEFAGLRPGIADKLRMRLNLIRSPLEVMQSGSLTRFRMPVAAGTGPLLGPAAADWNEHRLRGALKRFACDSVYLSTPFFFLPQKQRDYRVHFDVIDNFHDQWANTRTGRFRRAFHREQLRRADTVSASSLQLCDYVQRLADRPAVYIPNGAPLADMRDAGPGAHSIRAHYGLENRFVVGFIGNHTMPFYGLERLVRAFVMARESRPELALLIVGPDADRALRYCKGKQDGVFIVGPVPPGEVAAYFHACDAGAHPYDPRPQTHDAMALNVIEFSAAGKPVLANPLKEFQRLALPNVRFTDSAEIHAWARALADRDSFAPFDRDALREHVAPFDWDRSAGLLAGTLGIRGEPPPAQESAPRQEVVHFHRKPLPDYHSIEKLFRALSDAMLPHAEVRREQCPEVSRAILPRLRNLRWAKRVQGEVNHITGDIHYLARALSGERTVLTVHDCVALRRATGLRRWLLRKLYFQWPVARAKIVTTISQATKDELVRQTGCSPDKIRVVPDCLSSAFQYSPSPFNAAMPTVLLIGTLPHKNLERTVEALAQLPCRLRVIGRLPQRQRELLKDSGLEHSTDQDLTTAQMVRAYIDSDVVGFASLYEGFGMPILEAQATGRAVVTSDLAPMSTVAAGGACLVDPSSVESIRAGFQRVFSDAGYREKLVADGLANVEQYRPPRIARMYLDIYDELRRGVSTPAPS